MSRYFISAIVFAVAPLSLAAAEPSPAPDSTPPATCQQMQPGGPGVMQQHMGDGAMGPGNMQQGQMMQQHGAMGPGNMPGNMSGHMQGHAMPHGSQAGMGPGNPQAMMQGQGQCPLVSPPESVPPQNGK